MVVDHRPFVRENSAVDARAYLEAISAKKLSRHVLLFVGSLTGKHNAGAAQWIIDSLAPKLPPDCCVILAGSGTDELAIPKATLNVIGVGEVDDIDAVIAGADVCLAPLVSGAGVKTKVLHYLAHGKRVVGTPVALEGIEDAPGCTAGALGQLSELVVAAIRSEEGANERKRRQREQCAWIDAHCGTFAISEQWRKVIDRVVARSDKSSTFGQLCD